MLRFLLIGLAVGVLQLAGLSMAAAGQAKYFVLVV
jgi:hypothetical protein